MKHLILIAGTARSGSTVLDMMLGAPKQALSTGEIYAWFRPWRRHHARLRCSCENEHCSRWSMLHEASERDVHRLLLDRNAVTTLVDSSKNLNWIIDSRRRAIDVGIGTTVLLVWKDPTALAHSYWKRGRDDWRRYFVRYHRQLIRSGIPFRSVNHGDLVRRPETVLRAVVDVLGGALTADDLPAMLGYASAEHHHLYGSSGTMRRLAEARASADDDAEISGLVAEGRDDAFEAGPKQAIESALRDDEDVRGIVAQLDARDVCKGEEVPEASERALMPVWYLKRRVRDTLTRHVPALRR